MSYETSLAILKNVSEIHDNQFKLDDSQINFMPSFVVNTVPADGLAPIGARTSAGTVTSMFLASPYKCMAPIIAPEF